jgi:ADP-heptose:LPS heptosyltransferase
VRRVCLFARSWYRGLGDLVPVNLFLQVLRQAYPRAEITHVVGEETAARHPDFFARHSCADRIVRCPNHWDDDAAHWEEFFARVRSAAYDCAIFDPLTQPLMARGMAGCGVGIRIGFASGAPDEQYLTSAISARPARGCPDLLDFVQALAGAVGVAAPAPEAAAPWFPFAARPLPVLASPVVALHPGGARDWNRRWPLARFGELGRRLVAEQGGSLVVLGPVEEAGELAELAELAGAGAMVCAGEPLDTVASWLAAADVLVGNDSALAHIAAAVRTPSVVLYGPGMTEFMWTRVYLRHDGINRHYECQTVRNLPRGHGVTTMPCRHSCHYPYESADGPYPRCLTDIPVDAVYQAVLRQLARGRRAPAPAGREV